MLSQHLGIPIFDADAEVHKMMAVGGKAVPWIRKHFPNCVVAGAVDRKELGKEVFDNQARLSLLERILHPLLQTEQRAFYCRMQRAGHRVVVFDIPLLFEKSDISVYDHILVVSAPAWLQKQRVMSRPGMTEERFKKILDRQVSDHLKRKWANYVVHSGLGKADTLRQLKEIVRDVAIRSGRRRS